MARPGAGAVSAPGSAGRAQQAPRQGFLHPASRKVPEPQGPPPKRQRLFPNPTSYGWWSEPSTGRQERPCALILFSGPAREGDIRCRLLKMGWRVCCIDTEAPTPTNLLDDRVWTLLLADIKKGVFQAAWIATPCNTFSPLREHPPGPRPLRSKERIQGLPKASLSLAEQKQLKEANILVSHSAESACEMALLHLPVGIENPTHSKNKPQLWDMPEILKLVDRCKFEAVDFDQCRVGCEVTKPTRLLVHLLDFSNLNELRCNHELREWTMSDGSVRKAKHCSPAQRWREGEQGQERASKALGRYTAEFCKTIAAAIHKTQACAGWLSEELRREDIP